MAQVQSLIFIVLLMVIFYFMLIRPQKKRVEQHQQLIASVDVGDEIVTIGGLHGTVTAIDDESVELEAAPGVTLRFVKSAIARKVSEEVEEEETTEAEGAADEEPQALASGEENA